MEAGQRIVFGGNRTVRVPDEIAAAFEPGDRLIVVDDTGDLLHVPEREWTIATTAVARAHRAFLALGAVADEAVSDFYERFAANLEDDECFASIAAANRDDVEQARARGRSTTRLELSPQMRIGMIEGLRLWRDAPSSRNALVDSVDHTGWRVEQRLAGLGVVGFVFEGRPNVFADACGVLRSGNSVVFRIGSDALGTARAIVADALDPALAAAGLPAGSAGLVDSAAHAAGWAMFSDPRLGLAVARGSGPAVAQLGAVARQVGTAVSLHGTGGAWVVTGEACGPARLEAVVVNSLDRKVCNTLNTCAVLRESAGELVPLVLRGLDAAAAERGVAPKVHVTAAARRFVPPDWLDRTGEVVRAHGPATEQLVEEIGDDRLGHEWEWEESPEITIAVFDSVDDAVAAFNDQSPRFAASLVSDDEAEQERFWSAIDAPFVGDGFTRWVDGQYAFEKPELGLSNWQSGRLFARGGVLSGDSVYTVRAWARQSDPHLRR